MEGDEFGFIPIDDDVPSTKVRVKRIVLPQPKGKPKPTPSGEGKHLRKGIPDLSVIDIVPPPRFWEDIHCFRSKYVSYMPFDAPHISFINPFFVEEDLEEAAKILALRYKDLEPCTVTLQNIDTMPRKRKNSITVFVQPVVDPPDGLDKLMKIFLEVFPQCDDLWKRFGYRYGPHLTIAQFQTEEEYQNTFPEIQKLWKPFSFLLKEIYFITRPVKRHPFEVKQVVPIGSNVTPPHLGPGLLPNENKLHRTLVVVGIPKDFDQNVLIDLFSKTRPALSAQVLPNPNKIADWCCGLVEFESSEVLKDVMSSYDTNIFPGMSTYVKPLVYLMMVVRNLKEK